MTPKCAHGVWIPGGTRSEVACRDCLEESLRGRIAAALALVDLAIEDLEMVPAPLGALCRMDQIRAALTGEAR